VKYVILIHSNPESRQIWESFSETQQQEGYAAYAALADELNARGELIVTEALADGSAAKRVRTTENGVVTSDGPFAEAKEQLAGFFLVDCASEERAIEIAASFPEAFLGLIEVRPVMTLSAAEG
jgi:hypothetical protein